MGELGERVGIAPALAFSVLISVICTLATLLVWERSFGGVRAAAHEPAWLWLGGVMSVLIVLAITVAAPRIGVTATIALVIAGNLAMAVVIDNWGLLGQDQIPISWQRVVGLVLLAAGSALTLART